MGLKQQILEVLLLTDLMPRGSWCVLQMQLSQAPVAIFVDVTPQSRADSELPITHTQAIRQSHNSMISAVSFDCLQSSLLSWALWQLELQTISKRMKPAWQMEFSAASHSSKDRACGIQLDSAATSYQPCNCVAGQSIDTVPTGCARGSVTAYSIANRK